MSPPPARARARAAWSRLPPVRKNGTYNPPINRTSVGDEYGAGNPEVRVGCPAPLFRYGRERAAAATLTYYSNNVRENEVNAPSRRAKDVLYKISFDGPFQ